LLSLERVGNFLAPRYLLASLPKKSSPPAALPLASTTPSKKFQCNSQYNPHTDQKSAITEFRTSWGVLISRLLFGQITTILLWPPGNPFEQEAGAPPPRNHPATTRPGPPRPHPGPPTAPLRSRRRKRCNMSFGGSSSSGCCLLLVSGSLVRLDFFSCWAGAARPSPWQLLHHLLRIRPRHQSTQQDLCPARLQYCGFCVLSSVFLVVLWTPPLALGGRPRGSPGHASTIPSARNRK
jgi:hypothetical protein